MQLAARSCLTAAAALAVGSVIAVAPAVTPSLPHVQKPAVQLTALDDGLSGVVTDVEGLFSGGGLAAALSPDAMTNPSDTLEGLMQSFNTNLVTGELAFNHALTGGELQFEETIFGSDSALNGVVNRSFNVFNMGVDAGERGFNGVIGAPDGIFHARADVADIFQAPGNQITDSLILGLGSGGPFDDGSIGGLEGMFGQGYMVFADSLGLLADPTSLLGAFDPTAALGAFDPTDLLTAVNPLDFLGI